MSLKKNYNIYKKNIFSQNGEDGVILQILKEIDIDLKNLEVCEFGASDGVEYSNTFNLVKKFNAKAVYIEEDKDLFLSLMQLQSKYQSIIPINKSVNFVKPNTLDEILKGTGISQNFDVLSIDIDSDDLKVWMSLKKYSPKIVIIEINNDLKPGIYQLNDHKNKKIGNSFTSTLQVGIQKGYILVHHYGNLIFIKKEYAKNLSLDKIYLEDPNLLFTYDWINKKNEFKSINLIKLFLPKFIVRKISVKFKNKIMRLLYRYKF